MSQNGLSFLSKFDPRLLIFKIIILINLNLAKLYFVSDFFEIAKDLPASLDVPDQVDQQSIGNNIQIVGTHILVPQDSISRMV